MSFRTRFASLCNLMFPCFSFAEELSDEDVNQEFPCFDSYGASKELPESVIREILSKLPVESIITYRGVCKSWYRLIDEISEKSDRDQKGSGLDFSYVSEQPDFDIHLNLPIESIRGVCKAWNQFGNELCDDKEDEDKTPHLSDSSCLSELHNSVIHEILVKLPIKSIIQCRYVCKSWYKLISNPYFAKVYFKNPSLTSFAFSQHNATISCPDDDSFGFIEIGEIGDVRRKPMNVKALTSAVPKGKKSWKTLIGSCDGLLCLVEIPYEDCYEVCFTIAYRLRGPNQIVWIVNPFIGEYMELPKVHVVNHVSEVYGFGSTVDGNHYKVLRVGRKNHSYVADAKILTIGVDEKWRDLDISTFPAFLWSHGVPVTLNGVFHWVSYGRYGDSWRYLIYAFDIEKETGQYFPFPFEHSSYDCYLVAWDGHLCITDNRKEHQVDLWTMKRYGVMESWRRDIILLNNNSFGYLELIPIGTMRNGNLLLLRQFDQSLMSFDPKTKKCVEVEVCKLFGIRFSIFPYTPSFISLLGMSSRQISVIDS